MRRVLNMAATAAGAAGVWMFNSRNVAVLEASEKETLLGLEPPQLNENNTIPKTNFSDEAEEVSIPSSDSSEEDVSVTSDNVDEEKSGLEPPEEDGNNAVSKTNSSDDAEEVTTPSSDSSGEDVYGLFFSTGVTETLLKLYPSKYPNVCADQVLINTNSLSTEERAELEAKLGTKYQAGLCLVPKPALHTARSAYTATQNLPRTYVHLHP